MDFDDSQVATSLVPAIGGYDEFQLLAHGATSLVFKARQVRLGRPVAIKIISAGPPASRELTTTIALSNQPHMVPIIDTGTTEDGRSYIVMEFCEGGSYGQILRTGGPLDVTEVLEVGVNIAEALAAAHSAGVLHRDVKPSNILRSRNGPALTDFGIARAADELGATATREMMTPYYAAPEALLMQAQSGLSDLYSLAATLWTLLAGHPPYVDPSQDEVDIFALRDRVLNDPLPPMLRGDVPQWLTTELTRALSRLPGQRHSSTAEFAQALRSAGTAMAGTGSRFSAPVTPTPVQLADAAKLSLDPADAAKLSLDPADAGWAPPPASAQSAPQPLSPRTLPPQTLSPQTLPPQTLPPQTLSPQTLPPQTLPPQTLPAQTLPPETWPPRPWSPPPGPATSGEAWTSAPAAPPSGAGESGAWPGSAADAGFEQTGGWLGATPAQDPAQFPPPAQFQPPARFQTPTQFQPPAPFQAPAQSQDRPLRTPPQPQAPHQASAKSLPQPRRARASGRGRMLLVIAAGTLIGVLAAAALRITAFRPQPPTASPSASASPTSGHGGEGAPSSVTLADHGATVVVSWPDPSAGRASFVVSATPSSGPRPDAIQAPQATTSATFTGLNPRMNYCFVVGAVYSVDHVATSTAACTHR